MIVGSTIIYAYLLAMTVFLLDFVYALVDPRVKVGGMTMNNFKRNLREICATRLRSWVRGDHLLLIGDSHLCHDHDPLSKGHPICGVAARMSGIRTRSSLLRHGSTFFPRKKILSHL